MINFEKKYLKYKQKYLMDKLKGGSASLDSDPNDTQSVDTTTIENLPEFTERLQKQQQQQQQQQPQQQQPFKNVKLEPLETDVDLLETLLNKITNPEDSKSKHMKALKACIISKAEESTSPTMTSTLARLLVNTILENIDISEMSEETKMYLNTIKYIRLKKAIGIPINLTFENMNIDELEDLAELDEDLQNELKKSPVEYYVIPYISKKYTDLFSQKKILQSLYPNIYVPQTLYGVMCKKYYLVQGIKYKIIVNNKDSEDKFPVSFISMDLSKEIYHRLHAYQYTNLYLDTSGSFIEEDKTSPNLKEDKTSSSFKKEESNDLFKQMKLLEELPGRGKINVQDFGPYLAKISITEKRENWKPEQSSKSDHSPLLEIVEEQGTDGSYMNHFSFKSKKILGPFLTVQNEDVGSDNVNNYLDFILHRLKSDRKNVTDSKKPSINITYYYCLEDLIELLNDNKNNVDDNSELLELIITEFQSLTHKKIDIDFICSLLKYVKDLVSKKNVPQFITSINKIAKEFIEHILLKYYSDEAFIEYLLKENKDNLLALLEKNQAYYEDTRKSFGKSTSGSNLSEELDKNIGEIHQIKITSENGEEARVNYQQVGKK